MPCIAVRLYAPKTCGWEMVCENQSLIRNRLVENPLSCAGYGIRRVVNGCAPRWMAQVDRMSGHISDGKKVLLV